VVEQEYSKLTSQILHMKLKGEILLMGDFNAKLKVTKGDMTVQEQSRNGAQLQKLIDNTQLVAVSTKADRGMWTWENRSNTTQKSVIDYLLATKDLAKNMGGITIDEIGVMRLKSQAGKESDHNTITATINITHKPQKDTIKRWKTSNKEGWTKFNTEMEKHLWNNYDTFESDLRNIMEQTIGSTTITPNNNNKIKSKEINKLHKTNKDMRKLYQKACHQKDPNRNALLQEYYMSQTKLREEIEREIKNKTTDNIMIIKREGGTKSRKFWQIRKKTIGRKSKANYNTVTEDGRILDDPTESKDYIADYYEDLYQAREGLTEYQQWTEKIRTEVIEIETTVSEIREPPFTTKEVESVIKSLKRNKSTGPDRIPNEIFIEASKGTINTYKHIFNHILETRQIPQQWQRGELIRLYKGKGTKGKCSSERGITLASNTGKVFERLINNRAIERVSMTDAQAGGRKGRATDDHILTLKQLIQINDNNKKPTYITFLDVTKAYDKAWLDAIMHVMHKQGLVTSLWTVIKNLNENLTAKIATKYGHTREIKITDSIRQGGVLSVLEFALLMDEISKEIKKQNLGTPIPNSEEKVGCILWMDDVLLITPCPKEMQQMLDIVNELAGR
jgi:hypothetical protein